MALTFPSTDANVGVTRLRGERALLLVAAVVGLTAPLIFGQPSLLPLGAIVAYFCDGWFRSTQRSYAAALLRRTTELPPAVAASEAFAAAPHGSQTYVDALATLASVALQRGEGAAAMRLLARITLNFAPPHALLAQTYLAVGETAAALRALEAPPPTRGNEHFAHMRIRALIQLGHLDEARVELRAAGDAVCTDASCELEEALIEAGRAAEAIPLAERSHEEPELRARAAWNLAVAHERLGRPDEGARWLLRALEGDTIQEPLFRPERLGALRERPEVRDALERVRVAREPLKTHWILERLLRPAAQEQPPLAWMALSGVTAGLAFSVAELARIALPDTHPGWVLLRGAVAGAVFGFAQWAVLRRRLPVSAAWVPATTGIVALAALALEQAPPGPLLSFAQLIGAPLMVAVIFQRLLLAQWVPGWSWAGLAWAVFIVASSAAAVMSRGAGPAGAVLAGYGVGLLIGGWQAYVVDEWLGVRPVGFISRKLPPLRAQRGTPHVLPLVPAGTLPFSHATFPGDHFIGPLTAAVRPVVVESLLRHDRYVVLHGRDREFLARIDPPAPEADRVEQRTIARFHPGGVELVEEHYPADLDAARAELVTLLDGTPMRTLAMHRAREAARGMADPVWIAYRVAWAAGPRQLDRMFGATSWEERMQLLRQCVAEQEEQAGATTPAARA